MQDIDQVKFKNLYNKWIDDDLSKEELIVFYRFLKNDSNREFYLDILDSPLENMESLENGFKNKDIVYESIVKKIEESKFILWKKLWPYVSIAAAVILCFGLGLYFFKSGSSFNEYDKKSINPISSSVQIKDSRGGNVSWSEFETKKHYQDIYIEDNVLRVSPINDEIVYYTIDNPRGKEVLTIILSDSTKLMLNAGSSIHFPNNFNPKKRQISMKGEVYFDVTHRNYQPFIVENENITIDVLGTTFNVRSFESEENIETTLISGSVRVNDGQGKSLIIKPGQQANYNLKSGQLTRKEVSLEKITAWKEGILILDDESLLSILKEIERIYDVNCVFDPDFRDIKIWGTISTKDSLKDILSSLEKVSGVELKLEDRKIIINQK